MVMTDKELGEKLLSFRTKHEPQKGYFLLANPFMLDPNFRKTVVLLTEHDDQHSVGYVINRPLNISLKQLAPKLYIEGSSLGYGGPVQTETLHVLHSRPDLIGGEEVIPGVYWGADFEALEKAIAEGKITPDSIRFFLGYAGWGPKQLYFELEEDSWIVIPATAEVIFEPPSEDLWGYLMDLLGFPYNVMKRFPPTPSLN